MKFLICMPTGKDGIQDDAVIQHCQKQKSRRKRQLKRCCKCREQIAAAQIYVRHFLPYKTRRKILHSLLGIAPA